MNNFYAMQRANGDWFALEDEGRLRVPVFQSSNHAMVARSRVSGMECFRPHVLDPRVVNELTTADPSVCFWLVENPAIKLSQGRPMDHAQLDSFLRTPAAESKNNGSRN
ncbi:MAG: hypothetical protein QOD75_548 [Blastocatellia bacterium]|jgi:hypothetical protein|nr:hypothetical protein [Blastocatellia bacterium]